MSNWKQNLTIAAVLLAVDAYFLINSLAYPEDSNTFPLLLSILLGIVTLALAGQALLQARKEGNVPFVVFAPYKKVGIQALLIAAFAAAAPYISYPLAGFFLCYATARNGGYANRMIAVIFSAGVSAFVFAVFKIVLGVPLPPGVFAL